ncbi:MAG: hypothetical protein ACRCU6_12540 [Fusobacteriaceae bacterium]
MNIKELNYLMELIEKHGHTRGITVDTPIGEIKKMLELAGMVH